MSRQEKNKFPERREGRTIAFQCLYSFDFEKKNTEELIGIALSEKQYPGAAVDYARKLLNGTIVNIELIDKVIKSKLKNWDFDRISLVDKAVLRLAIYSIIWEDVPIVITINEAVEIIKQYGEEESYKFVNGILDAVKRDKEQTKQVSKKISKDSK